MQKEQLATQEAKIVQLQQEYDDHKQGTAPTKGLALQNYREKEMFLKYEVGFLKLEKLSFFKYLFLYFLKIFSMYIKNSFCFNFFSITIFFFLL